MDNPHPFKIIEVDLPNYELGEQPVPSLFTVIWDSLDPETTGELQISTWSDPSNSEIRLVEPNIVAVPNNEEALVKCLKEVAEYKKIIFEELGITNDTPKQIVFIILHERKHKDHFDEGRIRPYMPKSELSILENEADAYAKEKLYTLR